MRRLINKLTFWQKPREEGGRMAARGPVVSVQQVKNLTKRGLLLGAVCLGLLGWMNKTLVLEQGFALSAKTGLALTELHISGRNYTSTADIKSAIGSAYGTALLSVSLAEVKHNLEQLGWVKHAAVSRHYPNAIAISLEERRPLALLQSAGGHRLIDQHGSIIFGAPATAFSHLPVVSGEGAAEQAKYIIEALRTEPDLFADVWAIQRISNRRWDVHLRTGMAVRLPEKDAVLAWSKLAILDRDTKIMKRDLATIDMRVSGQLIVEPNLPLSKKGQKT